ncbi:MAG: hypothetical protein V1778_03580 [bacterium]
MRKFNPDKAGSYSDIPDFDKPDYKELADGGFVKQTAVENPELAHSMGLLENRVIDVLKSDKELTPRTFKKTIEDYKKLGDWERLRELMRRFNDLEVLSGGGDDPTLKEKLRSPDSNKIPLSQKTQSLFEQFIDPSDGDLVTELLLNERVTNNEIKEALLRRLPEDVLQAVFDSEKIGQRPEIVTMIALVSNDVSRKINYFKNCNYENYELAFRIAQQLIDSGHTIELCKALIEEGAPGSFRMLRDIIVKLEPEETLYKTLVALPHQGVIEAAFFNVGEPATFAKIIENRGADFVELDAKAKEEVTKRAEYLFHALSSEPQIYEIDKLVMENDINNKFIIGTGATMDPSTEKWVAGHGTYYIAWSDAEKHDHPSLADSCHNERGVWLGQIRGGYISLKNEGDKTIATFRKSSGNFGKYGHRVLEHFTPQLKVALQSSLGRDAVEVVIEVSN